MNSLKTVLITGATSGIGLKTAQIFDDKGWEVIILARSEQKFKEVSQTFKTPPHLVLADLSDTSDVQKACKKLKTQFWSGQLTTVVNAAGIVHRKPHDQHTANDWAHTFQVNLFQAVQITEACIVFLKSTSGTKHIINISSTLSQKPIENTSAYCASKAALNLWTQSLALELAPFKITANAICPGIIDTPIHKIDDSDDPSDVREQMHQLQPLKRMGRPDDIALNIFHLTEPACEWITGTTPVIDGGISLL